MNKTTFRTNIWMKSANKAVMASFANIGDSSKLNQKSNNDKDL